MPPYAGRSRQPSLVLIRAIPGQPAPAMTIVLDEPIGSLRTFTASGVVGEFRRRQLGPGLLNRRNNAPLSLHFIATSEQRRVTAHGIEQQRFIGCGRFTAKSIAIRKVHVHADGAHLWPRLLCPKTHRDAFVRLDAHGDEIGRASWRER